MCERGRIAIAIMDFLWCLQRVRNESIIGNKVIRFIFIVLLFLFFIVLVYLSYYVDLFWVFKSKKYLFLSFYTQFPEFTKNRNNLNAAKCNCRPEMRRITMNEQSTNNGLGSCWKSCYTIRELRITDEIIFSLILCRITLLIFPILDFDVFIKQLISFWNSLLWSSMVIMPLSLLALVLYQVLAGLFFFCNLLCCIYFLDLFLGWLSVGFSNVFFKEFFVLILL